MELQYWELKDLLYLTAGGCYLIIGKPGHGHYWQFLGEEQYVSLPRPKSSYPLQREVPSQAMSEDIVEVIDGRGYRGAEARGLPP